MAADREEILRKIVKQHTFAVTERDRAVGEMAFARGVLAAVREAWDAARNVFDRSADFEAGYGRGMEDGYDLHIHDTTGEYAVCPDRMTWERVTKELRLQEFAAALRREKAGRGEERKGRNATKV